MSKAIERRMVLRDQVTPTMSKINKSTLKYKKNIKTLKQDGNRTFWALKRNIMGVAFAGAAMVKSLLAVREMEEAYVRQSQAVAKLEAVFKATGMATTAQITGLKKYSSELQKVGVVGDEVILSGMQQLATFNVTSDTVKVLSTGMMDLVAQTKGLNATQEDAVNIANMVGKAMTGQLGALSRVGIIFSEAQGEVLKYGTESERAAMMAQVLQQNVGGVNAALAATDEGQIKQVKNAVGDLQEILGGVIVRVKGGFARVFNENLPVIEAKVNAVADAVNRWVDEGGVERFIETLKLTKDTISDLKPVFQIAAVMLAGYKVTAFETMIAQQGLNAAMAANPVGFVISALAALVIAIVMVRKHSDGAVNAMIGGLNTLISGFISLAKGVVWIFQSMWNSLVSMAERKVRDLITPINMVLSALDKKVIEVDFSVAKWDKVDPTYAKKDYIKGIEIKKASDNTMSDIEEFRARKQQKDIEDNTAAMAALTETLDSNTEAVGSNTKALLQSNRDMTDEEIADKLLPRLERVVYG